MKEKHTKNCFFFFFTQKINLNNKKILKTLHDANLD